MISDGNTKDFVISLLDDDNNPIQNKRIIFELNGKTFTRTTDSAGKISIPISLGIGNYAIISKFEGDNEYLKANSSNTINVIEAISTNIQVASLLGDATISINFSKSINEAITVIIDSSYYSINIENGTGTLTLSNLNAGNHGISIDLENYDIHANDSFNINKNVTVKASDFSTYYKSGSKYTITLTNNGKALANRTITFVLDGNSYTRTTNANGQASININLKTGNYKINIINYENKEVKTQNIKVLATLSKNSDISKYYGNNKAYKVYVIGDNGKSVGAGKVVTMKINGKTYNVKTDKNGYASLNVNLSPKKYTITAEFKGYKVSNKITIKPTIITKNLSVKKAKTVKYTAKLVNSNGKILKSKAISFKFKGKTYKVKTNSKGIATLSLKNLKVGKYSISSTYGKLTVKNTITIK